MIGDSFDSFFSFVIHLHVMLHFPVHIDLEFCGPFGLVFFSFVKYIWVSKFMSGVSSSFSCFLSLFSLDPSPGIRGVSYMYIQCIINWSTI